MGTTGMSTMTKAEQRARQRFAVIREVLGARCAQCRCGRVLLHCICVAFDRQISWHFRGIIREFT